MSKHDGFVVPLMVVVASFRLACNLIIDEVNIHILSRLGIINESKKIRNKHKSILSLDWYHTLISIRRQGVNFSVFSNSEN